MSEMEPLAEAELRAIRERCLVEVDNLNRLRQPDGSIPEMALEGVHVDLLTATKEAAMPYAVSTTHQTRTPDGRFLWMDQYDDDVARSGYKFHKSPAALARVDVEVEEAIDLRHSLRPGYIRAFLSPRMTRKDAPLDVAEREHLAHDDMVRIHMLDIDPDADPDSPQAIRGKFMQSLLVRDVPLSAWVAMLHDPNNIFGHSVTVEDNGSALPVMQAHPYLELPEERLPEGVVSVVEAVVPYIQDEQTRRNVDAQLVLFRSNQEDMHRTAESIADRWLEFEVALADSLHYERATPGIERFLFQLQHNWGDGMLRMLDEHTLPNGGLRMTRELAAKIETAKQNTLWVAAAAATGNEKVLQKMGAKAQQLADNERLIQTLLASGYSAEQIAMIEAQNNRLVAASGVFVGAGCPGDAKGDFRSDSDGNTDRERPDAGENSSSEAGQAGWRWKAGICRVANCPTRPARTKVGPCSVCRRCQKEFDHGHNPAERYARASQETIIDALGNLLLAKDEPTLTTAK